MSSCQVVSRSFFGTKPIRPEKALDLSGGNLKQLALACLPKPPMGDTRNETFGMRISMLTDGRFLKFVRSAHQSFPPPPGDFHDGVGLSEARRSPLVVCFCWACFPSTSQDQKSDVVFLTTRCGGGWNVCPHLVRSLQLLQGKHVFFVQKEWARPKPESASPK